MKETLDDLEKCCMAMVFLNKKIITAKIMSQHYKDVLLFSKL